MINPKIKGLIKRYPDIRLLLLNDFINLGFLTALQPGFEGSDLVFILISFMKVFAEYIEASGDCTNNRSIHPDHSYNTIR